MVSFLDSFSDYFIGCINCIVASPVGIAAFGFVIFAVLFSFFYRIAGRGF